MRPLAIAADEFARLLHRTRPPPGWPHNIAAATSGGPDSVCLLFLLRRHIALAPPNTSPSRVFSLTVDHALQPASAAMAEHCERFANALRVTHTTTTIPWGSPPFPPTPTPGGSFEATARAARYHVLWQEMKKHDIGVLALGHHADDQVETALMRLGRQSSQLGGRGMLGCRRWGMGMHGLSWAGHEGMNKWIIRPLLEVSKDRILATCEENKLDYVSDPTNFQPEITLRNALRAIIASSDKGEEPPDLNSFPPDIARRLQEINSNISTFSHLSIDLNSTSDRLRGAVKAIDTYAADVESQATSYIDKIRLPSPPGTFIISTNALFGITNPLIQRAIILRILRYISFHPWGSLRSQARRSRHSLDQIVKKVWHPAPFDVGISPFSAGAGVLWAPIVVDPTELGFIPVAGVGSALEIGGRIKRPNPQQISSGRIPLGKGDVGWLVHRQPPYRETKLEEYGVEDTLNIDLTSTLKAALAAWDEGRGSGSDVVEVLYDCRFLIKIHLSRMPKAIMDAILLHQAQSPKIAIRPWTRSFCWPKIVIFILDPAPPKTTPHWIPAIDEVTLHSSIDSHSQIPPFTWVKQREPSIQRRKRLKKMEPPVTSNWITTSWIRTLDPS